MREFSEVVRIFPRRVQRRVARGKKISYLDWNKRAARHWVFNYASYEDSKRMVDDLLDVKQVAEANQWWYA